MNGGSNPKRPVGGWDNIHLAEYGLTDDIRSIILNYASKFRGVAAVDDPTGLCGLIELCLDFRTEFICGAGSPVLSPM